MSISRLCGWTTVRDPAPDYLQNSSAGCEAFFHALIWLRDGQLRLQCRTVCYSGDHVIDVIEDFEPLSLADIVGYLC